MYPEHVQESLLFYPDSLQEADEVWFVRDPIEGVTQTEWQKAYQGVIYGEFTPEEAAAQMQETLTKELDQFLEDRG
jgi:ABC-type glycerol-3-phosphate transport system substrate-binding protein